MTTESETNLPRATPLVCVVDDDDSVLDLTCRILKTNGYAVRGYAGAEDFFQDFDEENLACVVTDLRMPNVDGGELLKRLTAQGSIVSVIVLTGHADVRTAVRLMEEGATTLLEKPYHPNELLAAVDRAVRATLNRREARQRLAEARRNFDELTADEREVLECMVAGLANKSIAAQLHLSMRTIDRRRRAVLTKMEVNSVSELATLIAKLR
ncbi:MAG: response regulator [Planctomycetia bacterium]|nr:response regulator [Planctomycetia bacterium]